MQSVDQVDERLQQTLFRLGTLITGRAGSVREARVIADQLYCKDIYRVQHEKKVWGKIDPPPFPIRYPQRGWEYIWQQYPKYPYYVLDTEPEFMSLENQTEQAADSIQKLAALEFLCRPALSEGAVSQDVISLSIHDALRDPDTDEYIFPDPKHDAALIMQIQHQLAARSGIPMTPLRKEQEARLTQGIPQNPPQQTHTLPDGGDQEQQQLKTDPTLPTLAEDSLPDEAQRAFLSFLVDHPDTPISSVYKAVGFSGRKGNEIRECLRERGFIQELEVRADRGRPLKFVIPTMQAFQFLEKDPPSGRGGVIHRHVQQMVRDGAIAKGYSATCEKALGTGGIVDVHLEKGTQRMAVEIAITSTLERESTHIRNCLAAGYDYVYALFADEELEERVEKVLQDTCSEDAVRKVRLLPLSRLSQVGYG